jgi:hypothetical protein
MREQREKRADERFTSCVEINFSYFSSRHFAEHSSMTFNHSRGGMCFESTHALEPGVNLYIRAGQNPGEDSGAGNWELLRASTLAEVRWCEKTIDEYGTYYCVGVRYI